MEPAPHSTVDPAHHASAESSHDAGHDDAFYAHSNPKYFGLPLGVLIATAISAVAVGITLLKFVSTSL